MKFRKRGEFKKNKPTFRPAVFLSKENFAMKQLSDCFTTGQVSSDVITAAGFFDQLSREISPCLVEVIRIFELEPHLAGCLKSSASNGKKHCVAV